MNIIVIGLGSMGRRRIRLTQKHFDGYTMFGVDFSKERRDAAQKELGIRTWASLEEALEQESFECAFVCTSPLGHAGIIKSCLEADLNVFTEINLVDNGYEENIKLAKDKNKLLFLSSTMIYRDEMQYLYNNINRENKCMYTYHVGQYLPDWHPWESYKDFFIGKKETNGCREILAIELPWLSRVFGPFEEVMAVKSRVTKLDIDFDDCYMLQIIHENGTMGSFIVDVVACEPVRDLKIIGENLYVSWQGEPESFFIKKGSGDSLEQIKLYDKVEKEAGYNKTILENEYINELKQFFGELKGECETIYGFEDDVEILDIISEVER